MSSVAAAAPRPGAPCRSRVRGADVGDADGIARLHDRLDGTADDRRKSRRDLAAALGGDGVPARVDDHDPTGRQARGHARAQARAAGGARRLPRRFGAVRTEPEHARADRLSGAPGPGRRRPDGEHAGSDRRRRLASRARPLLRLDGRRLRHLDGGRAAPRRALRRPSLVALDLLRQRPDRHRRVRRPAGRAPCARNTRAPGDRLHRHGAARRRAHVDRALHEPGRRHLRLVVGADARAARAQRGGNSGLHSRRAPGERADPAALALPQPHLHRVERDRVHRRRLALRIGHLHPALPADRERRITDRSRASRCCR